NELPLRLCAHPKSPHCERSGNYDRIDIEFLRYFLGDSEHHGAPSSALLTDPLVLHSAALAENGAWSGDSAHPAHPRRRGDRLIISLLQTLCGASLRRQVVSPYPHGPQELSVHEGRPAHATPPSDTKRHCPARIPGETAWQSGRARGVAVGKNSTIEWCDHTFNPWIGCQKVSEGCDLCYAERMNK